MQEARSVLKGGRKAIPASFVEVIDTLIDTINSHQGIANASSSESSFGPLALIFLQTSILIVTERHFAFKKSLKKVGQSLKHQRAT